MYAKVAHKIVLRSPIIGTDCSHNYLGLNFNPDDDDFHAMKLRSTSEMFRAR
jgi:hypothetical protein